MIASRRNEAAYLDDTELFDDLKRTLLLNPADTFWVATYAAQEHLFGNLTKEEAATGVVPEFDTTGLRHMYDLWRTCKERDVLDEIRILQLQGELTGLDRALMRMPAFSEIVVAGNFFIFTRYSGDSPLFHRANATIRGNDPSNLSDKEIFDDLKVTLLSHPEETRWIAEYKTPLNEGLESMLDYIAHKDASGKRPAEYNTPGLRRLHELFHVCKDKDAKTATKILTRQKDITFLERESMLLPGYAAVVKTGHRFLSIRYSGKSPIVTPLSDDADEQYAI